MKLEELKRICEEASPAPWGMWCVTTAPQACPDGIDRPLVHGAAPPHEMGSDLDVAVGNRAGSVTDALRDAAFIQAAREDMPKLLSIVDNLLVKKIEILKTAISGCDSRLEAVTDTGIIHRRAVYCEELEILEGILAALEADEC